MSNYQPGLSVKEATGDRKTIHKLSSNENPVGPSPKAIAAMQEHLAGLNFYPERTDATLKVALVKYLSELSGHDVKAENVVTGNSGCDIIHLLSHAYLEQNTNIIICPPAFPVYELNAKHFGATTIEAPLEQEGFHFVPETIQAAITPETRIVYLCNPNNPTGTYFNSEQLQAILDVIPDDVIIAYDEVYHHFVTEEKPDAIAKVLASENIVIIHSFSKAFGLAGMRIGYGIAKAEIVAKMETKKSPFHLSTLKMVAAEAALADSEHIKNTVENNTAERRLMKSGLEVLGLKVWPSQSNFMIFECPDGLSPSELSDKLLSHNIMVRPAFGLENHLRVSIGIPDSNQLFLESMKNILS